MNILTLETGSSPMRLGQWRNDQVDERLVGRNAAGDLYAELRMSYEITRNLDVHLFESFEIRMRPCVRRRQLKSVEPHVNRLIQVAILIGIGRLANSREEQYKKHMLAIRLPRRSQINRLEDEFSHRVSRKQRFISNLTVLRTNQIGRRIPRIAAVLREEREDSRRDGGDDHCADRGAAISRSHLHRDSIFFIRRWPKAVRDYEVDLLRGNVQQL